MQKLNYAKCLIALVNSLQTVISRAAAGRRNWTDRNGQCAGQHVTSRHAVSWRKPRLSECCFRCCCWAVLSRQCQKRLSLCSILFRRMRSIACWFSPPPPPPAVFAYRPLRVFVLLIFVQLCHERRESGLCVFVLLILFSSAIKHGVRFMIWLGCNSQTHDIALCLQPGKYC